MKNDFLENTKSFKDLEKPAFNLAEKINTLEKYEGFIEKLFTISKKIKSLNKRIVIGVVERLKMPKNIDSKISLSNKIDASSSLESNLRLYEDLKEQLTALSKTSDSLIESYLDYFHLCSKVRFRLLSIVRVLKVKEKSIKDFSDYGKNFEKLDLNYQMQDVYRIFKKGFQDLKSLNKSEAILQLLPSYLESIRETTQQLPEDDQGVKKKLEELLNSVELDKVKEGLVKSEEFYQDISNDFQSISK